MRRSGFNVIELAVVIVVAFLAMAVFFQAYNAGIGRAVTASAVARGRDVYLALASASSGGTAAEVLASASASCSNSTAFFGRLIESGAFGDLTYGDLVVGGMPTGARGTLSASNNMWSVAVNLRDDLPEALPLLITRNVDLAVCRKRLSRRDTDAPVSFDPLQPMPWDDRWFLCIRRGGAVYVGRRPHAKLHDLFGRNIYDPASDLAGKPVLRPLTYLTPASAIVPGGIGE